METKLNFQMRMRSLLDVSAMSMIDLPRNIQQRAHPHLEIKFGFHKKTSIAGCGYRQLSGSAESGLVAHESRFVGAQSLPSNRRRNGACSSGRHALLFVACF